MANVKRLKHGTLQASLHDEWGTYQIERWDGTRWRWVDADMANKLGRPDLALSYDTKRQADAVLADSGLEWRK